MCVFTLYRIITYIFVIGDINTALEKHCMKSVRIRNFSGSFLLRISPYSVRIRENTNQKNSEYGHFSRSENLYLTVFHHFSMSVFMCKSFFFVHFLRLICINTSTVLAEVAAERKSHRI